MAAPALHLRRLGIVGVGLVGGSVALAARRAWPEVEIVGVDPARAGDQAARRIVDRLGALEDLGGADLVVLAAPVSANVSLLERLESVPDVRLATDVGGTKRAIVRAASRLRRPAFVGGHPMTGGAHAGPLHARADLFDGRRWFLTPAAAAPPEAVDDVEAFVTALGARPARVAAEAHDRMMAIVSHLPQLTASLLMESVGALGGAEALAWAGPGLADTTRLAAADAPWLLSALEANADQIVPALDELLAALQRARDDLAEGRSIASHLASAREWRERLVTAAR